MSAPHATPALRALSDTLVTPRPVLKTEPTRPLQVWLTCMHRSRRMKGLRPAGQPLSSVLPSGQLDRLEMLLAAARQLPAAGEAPYQTLAPPPCTATPPRPKPRPQPTPEVLHCAEDSFDEDGLR